MNRLRLKREITSVLKTEELEAVFAFLDRFTLKILINPLFTSLCQVDETIRWHSISAFGYVVPKIAQENLEDGRVVMRRFLWMLNDESGGIGWGVPEAMGEVMLHSEYLAEEYIHMLISYTMDDGPQLYQDGNFIELPLLQQGVLWGLCRIAPRYKVLMDQLHLEGNLGCYFSSPDSQVRGLACYLCGLLNYKSFQAQIINALEDHTPVRLYREGRFHNDTVSGLAGSALAFMA